MCEPAVVSTPSVQNRSLMRERHAFERPRLAARDALHRTPRAMASACSGVSVMKALSGRAASIAATCAAVSSRAENFFARQPVARLGEGEVGQRRLITRPPWARRRSRAPCSRRVGQDLVAAIAVAHHVLAHRQRHARRRSPSARRRRCRPRSAARSSSGSATARRRDAPARLSGTLMRASVAIRATVALSNAMM